MMETYAFAEWLPDLAPLGNPGITVAKNVRPIGTQGYRPFDALTTVSDALNARCQGATSAPASDGNVWGFAGTATKLYTSNGVAWADASLTAYDVADDGRWEFAHYVNQMVASYFSTGSIEVQVVNIGSATFGNLITSTRKPRFATICVFKDFLIGGKCYDAVDGAQFYRVWWSALGDIADFDPDISTQSDYQDLPADDGEVQRVVATKEYVTIYMERAVYRMTYVGGDIIFDIQKMVHNRGCQSPGSVAATNRHTYAQDADGFHVFDGTDIVAIGADKVDETFLDRFDVGFIDRVSACIDPLTKLYMCAFPTAADGTGDAQQIFIYYIPTGRWAYVEQEVELIFLDLSRGISLDDLDALFASIDEVVPNLDSRVWKGGNYLVGAFSTDHILGHFDGEPMDAMLETAEYQPFNGRRTYITEVWPLIDESTDEDATVTVQLGYRNTVGGAVTYTSAASVDTIGKANVRNEARFQRVRVNITGDWNIAQGCRVKAVAGGYR